MLDSVSDRLELAHTMHGSIVEAARGAVAMWSPRKFTFGNADVGGDHALWTLNFTSSELFLVPTSVLVTS